MTWHMGELVLLYPQLYAKTMFIESKLIFSLSSKIFF